MHNYVSTLGPIINSRVGNSLKTRTRFMFVNVANFIKTKKNIVIELNFFLRRSEIFFIKKA